MFKTFFWYNRCRQRFTIALSNTLLFSLISLKTQEIKWRKKNSHMVKNVYDVAPGYFDLERILLFPGRNVPGTADRQRRNGRSGPLLIRCDRLRPFDSLAAQLHVRRADCRACPLGGSFPLQRSLDSRMNGGHHRVGAVCLAGLAARIIAAHRTIADQLNPGWRIKIKIKLGVLPSLLSSQQLM